MVKTIEEDKNTARLDTIQNGDSWSDSMFQAENYHAFNLLSYWLDSQLHVHINQADRPINDLQYDTSWSDGRYTRHEWKIYYSGTTKIGLISARALLASVATAEISDMCTRRVNEVWPYFLAHFC